MNYDVLIIGSGVVGSSLAHSISDNGYKVAVLDAKSEAPNSFRHLSINKKSINKLLKRKKIYVSWNHSFEDIKIISINFFCETNKG